MKSYHFAALESLARKAVSSKDAQACQHIRERFVALPKKQQRRAWAELTRHGASDTNFICEFSALVFGSLVDMCRENQQ